MGHDLIAIYWIKAAEYLLAVVYLPLFVLFWRFVSPPRPRQARARAAASSWVDQLSGFFQVPPDLFFHPGHAWVRVEQGDTAVVGLDDFAQRLIGDLGTVRLPEVGATLVQGEPALTLDADETALAVLAPIGGTVTEVNPAVLESADVVKQSPYAEGWLFKVRNPRIESSLKGLLSGELARRWMETVQGRLASEMAGLDLGEVYADGGQLVDGLAPSLSPSGWDRIARRFLLTENGGRHVGS